MAHRSVSVFSLVHSVSHLAAAAHVWPFFPPTGVRSEGNGSSNAMGGKTKEVDKAIMSDGGVI